MDSQGAHNLVGETETYTDMQNTKRRCSDSLGNRGKTTCFHDQGRLH